MVNTIQVTMRHWRRAELEWRMVKDDCLAPLEAADDEEEAADGTEEGIEDGVLDEGTDANILSLHMRRKNII